MTLASEDGEKQDFAFHERPQEIAESLSESQVQAEPAWTAVIALISILCLPCPAIIGEKLTVAEIPTTGGGHRAIAETVKISHISQSL